MISNLTSSANMLTQKKRMRLRSQTLEEMSNIFGDERIYRYLTDKRAKKSFKIVARRATAAGC